METKRKLVIAAIVVLALASIKPLLAQSQEPVCDRFEYFSETGHNVCDLFLDFFQTRGGLEIFGYPITEPFYQDGFLVQYFQRVRMEYHPENPPAYHVQLGLLGDFLAPLGKRAPIPDSEKPGPNERGRRYFPETGHSVGYAFLEFYDQNGGLDIFGYPVTEFIWEDGRFVQYFQRALMEWDPNRRGIVLRDLGSIWVERHAHLRERTAPAPPLAEGQAIDENSPRVTKLQVTVWVRDAITGYSGQQTVWVFVSSQNSEPVPGATASLIIHYPQGDVAISPQPTNAAGYTTFEFEIQDPPRGELVIVEAIVRYKEHVTTALTSFFPWW